MQQTQPNRGGGTTVQSILQLLFSRMHSQSITGVAARSLHDIQQIAVRGPPITFDALVVFRPFYTPSYSLYLQPAFADAISNLHGTINDRDFLASGSYNAVPSGLIVRYSSKKYW